MPERSSLEAALLKLFATATRARIISADRLERGNKRLGGVWNCPTDILTTDVPLLFSFGRIREGELARELGTGQGSSKTPAKVIVAYNHGFS